MKYNNVIGCHLYLLGELICATGVCYCIRVVMSKHHMKGLVILVVLDVPHWLWHHNVIGVFIWHEWHLAPVIFPSSWLCSLVWLSPKLFTEVWVDDLSHFVRSFLVSGNKTSQLINLLCDNKDTGTNHYLAKICRSCRMLSLCVSTMWLVSNSVTQKFVFASFVIL